MWDHLEMYRCQQNHCKRDTFLRIFFDNDFHLYKIRATIRSFIDCENILNWKTEIEVENNELLKDELNVHLGQPVLSGVSYK